MKCDYICWMIYSMNDFIVSELKQKMIWSIIFSGLIDYRDTVYRMQGVRFEIRPAEMGHNVPHCHASYQGQNVSISLVDFSVLAGNIPKMKQGFAQGFVKANREVFKKFWNEYHDFVI